jgi:two-component sensor histidine kinase
MKPWHIFHGARHREGSEPGSGAYSRCVKEWAEPLLRIDSLIQRSDFMLTLADDGIGAAVPPASSAGAGHGLELHATLLAIIGGSLTCMAGETPGTHVTLRAPLHHAYATQTLAPSGAS